MASGNSKIAIYAALIGNGLIAVSKFVGAMVSGSSAMFSEGIHSVVDTGNQALILIGIGLSKKPATKHFPFGRGKEVYFWCFVVSILIFALGGGISLYEGIHQLVKPSHSESSIINYIILILSIFFEAGACFFAFKEFRRVQGRRSVIQAVREGKDPTIFTVLFEDVAAILGLITALIGITLTDYTGNPIYDGAASVIIGLILTGVAIWLAVETKGLLIGESASDDLLEKVKEAISADPCSEKIGDLLSMHLGPSEILLNINIEFVDGLTTTQIEESIRRIEGSIKSIDNRVFRVFIEAEAL